MPRGKSIWSIVLPGYFSIAQAQRAFGLSKSSLAECINVLKPKVKHVGGVCFIRVEDLEWWTLETYKPERNEETPRTMLYLFWNYPMDASGRPYGLNTPEVAFNHLNVTMKKA